MLMVNKVKGDTDIEEFKHFHMVESIHRLKKLTFSIPLPNLTNSEFFLLSTLMFRSEDCCGSLFVSGIARKMGISAPAVSKSLSGLESKGFITRTIDKQNRRNTWVSLTEEGKKEAECAHDYIKNFMDNVVVEMGEDNFSEMMRLFNMMVDITEKQLEKERRLSK